LRRLILVGLIIPAQAICEPISADRPGIGTDPDIAALQAEIGTDGQEYRLGITPKSEVDLANGVWGVKYLLTSSDKFKASIRADINGNIELPATITMSDKINIGTDIINLNTYVAQLNYNINKNATLSPSVYYDGKPRLAIFAAYIPQKNNNIQFDIGYDRRSISAGVSFKPSFTFNWN